MATADGRYHLVFNGEIYNYRELRARFGLQTRTAGDTETLLLGLQAHGESFIDALEGMYAFVLYDAVLRSWIAVRDPLGIKPLYVSQRQQRVVIASEPAVVAALSDASPDVQSIQEWRLIRRPVPGKSFFTGVDEILPGTVLRSDGGSRRFWSASRHTDRFRTDEFHALFIQVVREHEVSDVSNVALLSGGIDSALITAVSSVRHTYTVGLPQDNEFEHAQETAALLGRRWTGVALEPTQLVESWRRLTRLRGEPLALPNEGLIEGVCRAMAPQEKVVLSGEGADELMFGYDRLFRWALAAQRLDVDEFLRLYGYGDRLHATARLRECLGGLAEDKSPVEFVEDFFLQVHLPGLLRRVDFAAMAASREARVPFADRRLVDYCYRTNPASRIDDTHSKRPLRAMLQSLGLLGPLTRPKIGFSASLDPSHGRHRSYQYFQQVVLEELQWSSATPPASSTFSTSDTSTSCVTPDRFAIV